MPARVFVVTYPNPLAPRWCGDVWLSRAEMEFIRDVFIPRLETIIKPLPGARASASSR